MPNDENRLESAPLPNPFDRWLTEQLGRLPEADAPEELSDRIMAAIQPRRRPWWHSLLFSMSRPRTITFSFGQWVPVGAALALGLTIGIGFSKLPIGVVSPSGPQMAQLAYDADVHYQRGRKLLAANQAEEALVHLKRAVDIAPERALYQFWTGVGYWSLQDYDEELNHYKQALAIDPDFLPAHVYSGHNYLDRGNWQTALAHYQRVLQDVPDHAEALFNSGLAYRFKGDKARETEAWKSYLNYYDRRAESLQAVGYLNADGDYSYRSIPLGMVTLVKPSIQFRTGDDHLSDTSRATLDDISRVLGRNHNLELHIVAYAANDTPLAKSRAHAIRRYLIDSTSGLPPRRIKASWFGLPEVLEHGNRSYQLDSSIRVFATAADAM